MVVDLNPPPVHLRAELASDLRAWALRLLVVATLTYDAYVHATLAEQRWGSGHPFTEGQLFAAEAVGAALAAAALLTSTRRIVWAAAAVVALGGLVAVVAATYVDLPALGPFPSVYEPVWYGVKTRSAIAEGAGGVVALVMAVRR